MSSRRHYTSRKKDLNKQRGGFTPPEPSDLENRRLIETAQENSLEAALQLKTVLFKNKLNLVTVESLTAGMIAKTLIDVPGYGMALYGGFVVYDTDAKRQFVDVRTKGVYSNDTAQQMAEGALANSRAMVALAVTGNAMPSSEDAEELGIVYIGVSIRGKQGFVSGMTEIKVCDLKGVTGLCDNWKQLHIDRANGTSVNRVAFQFTSLIADYVRMKTVEFACLFAVEFIEKNINRIELGNLELLNYDAVCHPSPIISARIGGKLPSQACNSKEKSNISEVNNWKGYMKRSPSRTK